MRVIGPMLLLIGTTASTYIVALTLLPPDECHRGLGPAIMEKRNEIIRNTKDSFGNPISKKLFKMPKEAKVTSLARKSRIAEKKTKDYEYKNANKPEVA